MSRRRVGVARPILVKKTGETNRISARRVVISTFDNAANLHYNGGGVAVIEMIADRLSAEFDVTIVTAACRGGTEVRNGVRHVTLPAGWAGPRTSQLLFHALLPFAARRVPHDLWIENFTPPFSTSFLPLFSRGRVLGFAQALTGKELSLRYWFPFHLIERWGLRLYRDIVVLNSADQTLVRAYSPSTMVRLIPNGIQETTLTEQVLSRREHLLFIGRIDVWKKGLDMLLEAYEMSGLTIPLLMAGTGLPREERKFAKLLAASGSNVHWVGHVTGRHKQDLLERSAFVIMPSRHETFGLSALEGMSYGKPVMHFDLPSLRWMDGDVRVAPYDVGALAEQIRDLTADEAMRRELGRTAHATAQTFSRDKTADCYRELVHELLGTQVSGIKAEDGFPWQ